MKSLKQLHRLLVLTLVALLAWLPAAAQRIVHDPKEWLPQQRLGTSLQVTMTSPQGQVLHGTLVSAEQDRFTLQPKGGFFHHHPNPEVIAYSNVRFVESYNPPSKDNHALVVAAIVATVVVVPIVVALIVRFVIYSGVR